MIEQWKRKRVEKSFEDGQYLGYYYQLVKGNIFWIARFQENSRLKFTVKKLSLTKNSARKRIFQTISDYHFSKLEISRKSVVDYDKL